MFGIAVLATVILLAAWMSGDKRLHWIGGSTAALMVATATGLAGGSVAATPLEMGGTFLALTAALAVSCSPRRAE
ncbi:MAG: hypothetical protein WAN50_00705 [Minisyncoccia bacterium]